MWIKSNKHHSGICKLSNCILWDTYRLWLGQTIGNKGSTALSNHCYSQPDFPYYRQTRYCFQRSSTHSHRSDCSPYKYKAIVLSLLILEEERLYCCSGYQGALNWRNYQFHGALPECVDCCVKVRFRADLNYEYQKVSLRYYFHPKIDTIMMSIEWFVVGKYQGCYLPKKAF